MTILTRIFFSGLLASILTACGTNQVAPSASLNDEAQPADANRYTCQNLYYDTNIQETPLWTEGYDFDVGASDTTLKKFGVSPGDGDYYSNLGLNGAEGIALQIFNNSTHVGTFAAYEFGSNRLLASLQTSATQTLVVTCAEVE